MHLKNNTKAMDKLRNIIDELKTKNNELEKSLIVMKNQQDSEIDKEICDMKLQHQEEINKQKQNYENQLKEISELHKQEKILLLEKLETKQTFTFGEKSKRNPSDSDLQSNYSLRDEIDKLHFVIEEKDYINSELKHEVNLLREKIDTFTNYPEDDFEEKQKEIENLTKENKQLHNDLNQTEENYNDQCLFYKQKLNDERQRTIEVKEELTEMKNSYEKKISELSKGFEVLTTLHINIIFHS